MLPLFPAGVRLSYMQTKKQSLIETSVMLVAKTIVMIIGQIVYFRLYKGLEVTWGDSLEWALIAFVISFTMTYGGRRLFNHLHSK